MSTQLTQKYRLATLLEGGNLVPKEMIQTTLEIDAKSVPVYIHKLKKLFNAEIESVREGRKVVGYRLKNKITVGKYRSNNAQREKPVKPVLGEVPVLDPSVGVISDAEMRDVHAQLEIDTTGHKAD